MRQVAPGRTRITIELEEDDAAEIAAMLDAARQVLERPAHDGAVAMKWARSAKVTKWMRLLMSRSPRSCA